MERLACILAALTLCSCATGPGTSDAPATTLEALAADLLDRAEARADLGRMVVGIQGVTEAGTGGSSGVVRYRPREEVLVGVEDELEHGLLVALSERVRTLEPDWDRPGSRRLPGTPADTAATHLVVGDYVQRGDELTVSVRLVDVSTGLIVASSRAVVRAKDLSDRTRHALVERDRRVAVALATLPVAPDAPALGAATAAPVTTSVPLGDPGLPAATPPAQQTPALAREASPTVSAPAREAPLTAPPRTRRAPAAARAEPAVAVQRRPSRGGPAFFRWSSQGRRP